MMNNKNILKEIKQKYSGLLVTDPEDLTRICFWVSDCLPQSSWSEDTQIILDSQDWSAEILTFPELHEDRCFITIRYKRGNLREMKVLDGQDCTLENVAKILENKDMIKKSFDYGKYHDQMLEPKRFDGDIIITDPSYIMGSEWGNDPEMDIYSGFGFDKVFGDTYIYGSTIYGDWSCAVYGCGNRNPKEIIWKAEVSLDVLTDLPELGNFCADAGLVSVTYLDRSENIGNYGNHCWTMIPNFHGTVQYYRYKDVIHIVGISDDGDHNFVSFQTGL